MTLAVVLTNEGFIMILILACFIAICAVIVLLNPKSINVLSESDRKNMNSKKTAHIAFWGLMVTALILAILYIVGIRNELIPIFVGIPGVLITVTLIQCSIPNK